MNRTRLVASHALLLVLATRALAHAAGSPEDKVGRAPPKRIPDVVTQPAQPAGGAVTTATMPRDLRRAIASAAAKHLKVEESSVVLTRAERVTWSDGSLGCPQPGMMYTQALVPGYRVTAMTAAGEVVYHTDDRGQVVSCASSNVPPRHRAPATTPQTGVEPVTQPPVKSQPDR